MSTVTAGQLPSATRIVTIMAIVAGLYLGRELLIPFALALFFSLLLYPVVTRIRRAGLPRVAAVSVTIAITALVLSSLGFLVARQAIDLTNELPNYQENLKAKIRDIRPSGSGRIARLSDTITELKQELKSGPTTQTTQATDLAVVSQPGQPSTMPTTQPAESPVKVEVVNSDQDYGGMIVAMLVPLMSPIATAAITSLLVIFFLLYGDEMRGRLITVAGMRHISMTTSALDEAATRIGSFVRMQALVALCYAAMVTGTLLLFGVPNAILWGVLGFILRFIPYVGPWIAAIGPSLLAVAVFPGWATPLLVIGAFIVIELISNMVLEPWLYGSGTGLTPLGVVICFIFWAWLWGGVGMILAVPITSCMVVLGKNVSAFSLIRRLFGADVAVPEVGRLYQRALAGDDISVAEIVGDSLKKPTSDTNATDRTEASATVDAEALDELVLPAISELKQDLVTGAITEGVARRALAALKDAIVKTNEKPGPDAPLWIIAVQSEPDDLAALAIAQAARPRGISSAVISSEVLANEAADAVANSNARWFVLVHVNPASSQHERRLLRAIRQRDELKRPIFVLTMMDPESTAPTASDENVHRVKSAARLIDRIAELMMVRPDSDTKPSNLIPDPATDHQDTPRTKPATTAT
jgi:predicted PurR-regulated permease PerM